MQELLVWTLAMAVIGREAATATAAEDEEELYSDAPMWRTVDGGDKSSGGGSAGDMSRSDTKCIYTI